MRKVLFRNWLEKGGLRDRPVRDYLSRCSRVEAQLGDLDAAYLQDELAGILSQLVADNADFPMDGDRVQGMSSLRAAVRKYKRFCESSPPEFPAEQDTAGEPVPMLSAITIRNFKSYKDATLPLAPLTLLIGANASGKSNAVEALRLLQWGISHQAVDVWRNTIEGIRGKKERFFYTSNNAITMSVVQGDSTYECSFPQLQSPRPLVAPLPGKVILNQMRNAYTHAQKQAESPASSPAEADGSELVAVLRFQFLDTIPARTRDYADMQEDQLREDAANLSAVLYRLCKDEQHKKCLLEFVKSLPEQDIVDIDFIETPRDEVMVRLVESFGGRERFMDADSLSDGTLRVLALAAFLLAAPAGALLVVEELDSGIHPSRVKDLVRQMLSLARQRQVQILLTSHNPALLDALPYDALPDVVCCYRDSTEGDSRLVRLGDLPKYPAIMAQGTLGELVTRQVLDRYLHDTPTADEEKAAALDWLEQLRAATERTHE